MRELNSRNYFTMISMVNSAFQKNLESKTSDPLDNRQGSKLGLPLRKSPFRYGRVPKQRRGICCALQKKEKLTRASIPIRKRHIEFDLPMGYQSKEAESVGVIHGGWSPPESGVGDANAHCHPILSSFKISSTRLLALYNAVKCIA